MLLPLEGTSYPLRTPCKQCGGTAGVLRPTNGQECVFCAGCGRFQYNAPKTETGLSTRSTQTVHKAIRPRLRVRVIERATGRCELCGNRRPLHVGHLLSVDDGLPLGLTERELNSSENVAAMCEECNLGLGSLSISPRLYVAILKARCDAVR